MKERICPICKQKYYGYPALSRKDDKTEICPDCGVCEAMDDYMKYILKEKINEVELKRIRR